MYLRYYCEPSNVLDYAVMVKGKWGAGKTYLINLFIDELKRRGRDKILYVSLYGVTSFRQIDDALTPTRDVASVDRTWSRRGQ